MRLQDEATARICAELKRTRRSAKVVSNEQGKMDHCSGGGVGHGDEGITPIVTNGLHNVPHTIIIFAYIEYNNIYGVQRSWLC
jgi:hypothetical protein